MLGERIERRLYDLLDTLLEAKYTRDKGALLRAANRSLEILRFQMRLANLLIDASNEQEQVPLLFPGDDLFTAQERRRGIPIGNQTNRFFANVFLDALDHFVVERLRPGGYVR